MRWGLLADEGVAVMPGESFGAALAGWIRISLTQDDALVAEACASDRALCRVEARNGGMKTVGERLVEGLAARGVEVIFGIPGVHTVEMYRGLSGSSIRHVTARHEQGCAFMADGYARVSGKPGVALVITGPGILNALTAMGQAAADSVPMLVISGVNRRDSLGLGLGLLHELPDQAAMVRPLCPTRQIKAASEVGAVLDWAFATMATGRPGPVHIEVPTDVMPLDCDALPAPAALPVAAVPDLGAAVARLNAAQRGGDPGGRWRARARGGVAGAGREVGCAGRANGERARHDAWPSAGGAGLASLDAPRALIAQADQVLAIGTEFGPTDYDMYVRGGFPDLSGMIRVDICARAVGAAQGGRDAARRCGGGDGGAVAVGRAKAGAKARRGRRSRAQAARAELAELDALMPGRLEMVETIRSAMPGALIVGDSTQPIYAANLYYDHDRAGGWFNAATGFGALGYGPGAAVGAALAAPGAEVVCLIGDGGLQFSPGELRTAVDERLPITLSCGTTRPSARSPMRCAARIPR